ncbi:hypothetical protein B296_00018884 [Ensete ventricosum]|uniref:Uncharacterized protein n=1 Tax=Ensete ventricosum TaxID=4639 RepID=A0A426Z7H3_ENSVE|nr:hypothetical protein B296_00018884 [Ensete ventricosum]
MAVEEQRDAKNASLIPSVRTLGDSKLRVLSIGDRPPWNSIGVPPLSTSLPLVPTLIASLVSLLPATCRRCHLLAFMPYHTFCNLQWCHSLDPPSTTLHRSSPSVAATRH